MASGIKNITKPQILSLIVVAAAGTGLVLLNILSTRKPAKHLLFGEKVDNFCINSNCVKNEGGWWLTYDNKKVPADVEKSELMVKQLKQVELNDVASVNKDKFVQMGIADNSPTIKANGKELIIGSVANDYESTYVKSGDKIYRVPFVWNNSQYGQQSYWINLKVTNLPLYQIKKYTISKNNRETSFEQKDGKWPNQTVLEKIAHLEATSWIEEPKTNSYESLTYIIEVDGGSTKKLTIGQWRKNKKELLYWAKSDDNNYYQINKNDFDLLTR